MANNLFSLFDDRLKSHLDIIACEPQSIESLSNPIENDVMISKRLSKMEEAESKIDYSDFSNFIFFNSALDYFNISGEKILNEYPKDGSSDKLEIFCNDLDGFQRYLLEIWPKNSGYLRFQSNISSSYIEIKDTGVFDEVQRSCILSPGTGSLSLEFWCQIPDVLSGSETMILFQKMSGASDGYSLFVSGSNVVFQVASGSSVENVSASFSPNSTSYFSFVFDRSSEQPTLTAFSGNLNKFPEVVSSLNSSISGNILLGTSFAYIGSGTLSGKTTVPLTASIDEFRVWNSNLTSNDLSSSYNCKIFSQDGLLSLWRFNESGSSPTRSSNNDLVLDSSGHRINGQIKNYWSGVRCSGSLIPFDAPDPILFFDSSEVTSLISDKQLSASIYDRTNDNNITKLLPNQFFDLEDQAGTSVLRNFLYVIARQFDGVKSKIDQFVNVTRTNYGDFDQTPDALLYDIAKFFGWEFTGNFLDNNTSQYIFGRNILPGTSANRDIEIKLYDIKNEFWKRTLINLVYLYKTKGTRQSIESLLRIHGLPKNIIRLKEYGHKLFSSTETFRVYTDKSISVLTFGSGSLSASITSDIFDSTALSIESRLRFPTTSSQNLTSTILSGSVWSLYSSGSIFFNLSFEKPALNSLTGSLLLSSSDGDLVLSGATLFDNKWHNISLIRDNLSSSLRLYSRTLDRNLIESTVSSSLSCSIFSTSSPYIFVLGSTGSLKSQMWAQEIRVWDRVLNNVELDDHTLNFQSYGLENPVGKAGPSLHWRLIEQVTGSSDGSLSSDILDVSMNNVRGSGSNFSSGKDAHTKFLNDYSFITNSDFSWSDDKIRIINDVEVPMGDQFIDNSIVSLEMNMIDALNEDISQIIATFDCFNDFIGNPVNRYRSSYEDIEALREQYFKRLQGRLNFRIFFDMLEFFDRSFIDIVRRLIPARVIFAGEQFVVESHILERPKHQWYFGHQDIEDTSVAGVIGAFTRDTRQTSPIQSGLRFANVQSGTIKIFTRDKGRVWHVNTVMPVQQNPFDNNPNKDFSGVIRSRLPKAKTPRSILVVEYRSSNRFNEPIFDFTGK